MQQTQSQAQILRTGGARWEQKHTSFTPCISFYAAHTAPAPISQQASNLRARRVCVCVCGGARRLEMVDLCANAELLVSVTGPGINSACCALCLEDVV
jgi:hypothetical protein